MLSLPGTELPSIETKRPGAVPGVFCNKELSRVQWTLLPAGAMLGTEGGDSMAGQDKGFQPFYYNLSPRRKFIRTVWMTLLGVLVIAGWWWLAGLQTDLILFIAVFTVVDIWQLATTYAAWKAEEKQGPNP